MIFNEKNLLLDAVVAPKTALKARSARARGLRTLQHQTLPAATYYAIDTEVWFRGLILQGAPSPRRDQRWATKDQVHDEAIAWFLEHHSGGPLESHSARGAGDADLTFWLDSKLMVRARRLALRDGIKLSRLIEAALTAYVGQHVPEQLVEFRRRVHAEARNLYDARDVRRAVRVKQRVQKARR